MPLFRHILKVPQITSIELKAAKDKLDSIRAKLIAGTIKFGEAVNKFSDDESSKFTGGRIVNKEGDTFLNIDELDKDTCGNDERFESRRVFAANRICR